MMIVSNTAQARMRLPAAVLCAALLLTGSGCRTKPSAEKAAELRAAQARAASLARLVPRQRDVFSTLESNRLHPSVIGTVGTEMPAFRGAVERGASIGGDHLNQLAGVKSAETDLWVRTPAEKRVFLVGAISDGPTIWQLSETLRAGGYAVFLHDFRQGQSLRSSLGECPSALVGAYFGTAGHALVGVSDTAVRGPLFPSTTAPNASDVSAGMRRAILITPVEAATIGEAGATDFVAVEMEMRPLTIPHEGGEH